MSTRNVKPIKIRWTLLNLSLFPLIVVGIALASVSYVSLDAFQAFFAGDMSERAMLRQLEQFGVMSGLLAIASVFFTLLTAIFYCVFFHRAAFNLKMLGSRELDMSPVGVWAWNFVPIANFIMPVIGVTQVSRGTHKINGTTSKTGSVIAIWWILWIAAFVGQVFSGLLANDLEGYHGIDRVLLIALVGQIAAVFSAVALYFVVNSIAKGQMILPESNLADTF